MKESEIKDVLYGIYDYSFQVIEHVRPLFAIIIAGLSYLIFPDQAYVSPTIGLLIAIILDLITKYYAIGRKNGGLWKAIRSGNITSEAMWHGTKKKLLSILIVMIACGALFRFTPFLPEIAVTITTVAYAFMFLREIQSALENMIEAGHDDLTWFLIIIKRKKKDILNEHKLNRKNKKDTGTSIDNDKPTI